MERYEVDVAGKVEVAVGDKDMMSLTREEKDLLFFGKSECCIGCCNTTGREEVIWQGRAPHLLRYEACPPFSP